MKRAIWIGTAVLGAAMAAGCAQMQHYGPSAWFPAHHNQGPLMDDGDNYRPYNAPPRTVSAGYSAPANVTDTGAVGLGNAGQTPAGPPMPGYYNTNDPAGNTGTGAFVSSPGAPQSSSAEPLGFIRKPVPNNPAPAGGALSPNPAAQGSMGPNPAAEGSVGPNPVAGGAANNQENGNSGGPGSGAPGGGSGVPGGGSGVPGGGSGVPGSGARGGGSGAPGGGAAGGGAAGGGGSGAGGSGAGGGGGH